MKLMKFVKRMIARLFWRFILHHERVRLFFIHAQYSLMVWISGHSKKRTMSIEDFNELEEIYKNRYENWNRFLFIEDPNRDWFLQWDVFYRIWRMM